MNAGYIGAIVVLVLVIGFILYRKFKANPEKGKEEALKFLESIESDFEDIIISYLDKIDISNFDNLMEVEKEIIDALVDILWQKAITELDDQVSDKFTRVLIKKYLTREFVEQFINTVFEKARVQKVYTAKYNDAILAANKEAILLEAGITEKNKEIEDNVPIDFREVEDIDPSAIIDSDGNIIKKEINPQTDEEPEELDTTDNSIEIIE